MTDLLYDRVTLVQSFLKASLVRFLQDGYRWIDFFTFLGKVFSIYHSDHIYRFNLVKCKIKNKYHLSVEDYLKKFNISVLTITW